jgi:hypothetical protein
MLQQRPSQALVLLLLLLQLLLSLLQVAGMHTSGGCYRTMHVVSHNITPGGACKKVCRKMLAADTSYNREHSSLVSKVSDSMQLLMQPPIPL